MDPAVSAEDTPHQPRLAPPPPWSLKCTVYMIPFWTTSETAKSLPAKAFSPLEAGSPFASRDFGIPVGGLSMIQVIRYTESPVGPYDELILAPGFWKYPFEGRDGKKMVKKNIRITRIYVSQRNTCWGGRTNWNIPKHLARFEWTDEPNGSTQIKVFPHDTAGPYDAAEAQASERPFFQCTIKPISYLPSFPLTSKAFKYLGVDNSLVQPPLPEGLGSEGELAGTEKWCKLAGYTQSSSNTRLVWADMNQKDDNGNCEDEFDNFFPGLRRWNVAVKMADAATWFPAPETWETPKWLL